MHQMFQKLDEDDLGYLTSYQSVQLLGDILGFSDAQSRTAFQTYDKNNDEKIDYDEFIDFYSMIEEE